jgi:hypothetical protein
MDLPLRVRLLGAFVGMVVLSGPDYLAGSFLIKRMVISEAERRVALGLKTASAMWERRLDEALKSSVVMAEGDMAEKLSSHQAIDPLALEGLRTKLGYDFLHVLDCRGTPRSPVTGDEKCIPSSHSPVISRVIERGKPRRALSIPLEDLTFKPRRLAARTPSLGSALRAQAGESGNHLAMGA